MLVIGSVERKTYDSDPKLTILFKKFLATNLSVYLKNFSKKKLLAIPVCKPFGNSSCQLISPITLPTATLASPEPSAIAGFERKTSTNQGEYGFERKSSINQGEYGFERKSSTNQGEYSFERKSSTNQGEKVLREKQARTKENIVLRENQA